MTVYDSRDDFNALGAPPLWACALLGIVLIAAGFAALGDLAFATVISVKFIGITALAAGAFEIAHAFWTKGWGSFAWRIVLGALYLAFGLILLTQPASGALILTYLLGAMLLASGAVRCVLSFAYWRQNGWMMLISGVFAMIAGVLILFSFPNISVWALGFLLGVDLISHGLAWLLYALQSLRSTA
ncbi:HdeD family acid-resistance protein [Bradyrhizobium sp. RP6]|uniref:HdeD family acid-resistance protein n=1 Tax=Bradyrhizobium sp. RP6 TaxID=2489596 RepID=UPI0018F42075|nr:HdeD family acid-resistance protein [Bradyrhizobium sp. RP6]